MSVPYHQTGPFVCHGGGFHEWVDKNRIDFLFLGTTLVTKSI